MPWRRSAVARETVFALRQQNREDRGPAGRAAEVPAAHPAAARWLPAGMVLRRGMAAARADGFLLQTGVEPLDRALGGGLPKAALTEIHGAETRDAGASSALRWRLISLLAQGPERRPSLPLLWIGTSEIFREAGFPMRRASRALRHRPANRCCSPKRRKLDDALWVAEEAARLHGAAAVMLELRGNPAAARSHRDATAAPARAELAGRPVFLLRQAAEAEPTAAPVRLVVSSRRRPRRARTLAGPLAGSIGRPPSPSPSARAAPPCRTIHRWSGTPMSSPFEERQPAANLGAVVSPSRPPSGSCGSVWGGPGVHAPLASRAAGRSAIATATPSASRRSTSGLRR